MNLADLIRYGPVSRPATATGATHATQDAAAPVLPTVAPVASVAVAATPKLVSAGASTSGARTRLLRAVLRRKGIDDPDEVDRVVADACANPGSMAWWINQATNEDRANA